MVIGQASLNVGNVTGALNQNALDSKGQTQITVPRVSKLTTLMTMLVGANLLHIVAAAPTGNARPGTFGSMPLLGRSDGSYPQVEINKPDNDAINFARGLSNDFLDKGGMTTKVYNNANTCADMMVVYKAAGSDQYQQVQVDPREVAGFLNAVNAQDFNYACVAMAGKAAEDCLPGQAKTIVVNNDKSEIKNLRDLNVGDKVAIGIDANGQLQTSKISNIAHHITTDQTTPNDKKPEVVSVKYVDLKGTPRELSATGNHNIHYGLMQKDGSIKQQESTFRRLTQILGDNTDKLFIRGAGAQQWMPVYGIENKRVDEVINPITEKGSILVMEGPDNDFASSSSQQSVFTTIPDKYARPLHEAYTTLNNAYIQVSSAMPHFMRSAEPNKDGLGSSTLAKIVSLAANKAGESLGHI